MAYIRWPEWLNNRDQAYIYSVTDRWMERTGIAGMLDRSVQKNRRDIVESLVVNCALLALAAALKQAWKKLRRGEAIPFDDVRTAATGQLQRDLIWNYWKQLGEVRGMPMPLVNLRQLSPQVEALVARSHWQKTIQSRLKRIARIAAQPPGAASPRAMASTAAEFGAPIVPAPTEPAREHEITPAPAPEAAAAPEGVTRYPRRAAWLGEQLRIRGWNKHDLHRFGGPDRATTQKILDGLPVRELDVLSRVIEALSKGPSAKSPKVTLIDIPRD
jgi:hypothetical protein